MAHIFILQLSREKKLLNDFSWKKETKNRQLLHRKHQQFFTFLMELNWYFESISKDLAKSGCYFRKTCGSIIKGIKYWYDMTNLWHWFTCSGYCWFFLFFLITFTFTPVEVVKPASYSSLLMSSMRWRLYSEPLIFVVALPSPFQV